MNWKATLQTSALLAVKRFLEPENQKSARDGTVAQQAASATIGAWNPDPKARTISLPGGWTSVPVRLGPIVIRPPLHSVDVPQGWTVVPSGLVLPSPTPTPPPVSPPAQDPMDELISMHNSVRASNGRTPLVKNPKLMSSAGSYAVNMLQRGKLDHYGADGSTPWSRMTAAGYVWSDASENIASGQVSNGEVMADWEASPGHMADILGPYRDIGVGRAGNCWCVDFASPK